MKICIRDESTLLKSSVYWSSNWLNYCGKSHLLEASLPEANLQAAHNAAVPKYVCILGIECCIAPNYLL